MTARSPVRAAALAVALVALAAAPPYARQGTPQERSAADTLRAEVEAEEARVEALRAAGATELDALRAERRRLAEELLQVSLELESDALDAAEAEARAAERALDARLAELEAVLGAAQTALERTVLAARGVPGLDETAEAARADALAVAAAHAALPQAEALLDAAALGAEPEPELALDAVGRALDALGAGLDAADDVALVRTTVRTADGRAEAVELLRAGWVGFAYRTADGRLGLALSSPVDADGYRWSEALDPSTTATLAAAFEAAAAGGAVTMPVDPTGQLRPGALEARLTLTERLAAGGPLMVPLLLVALAAVLLALERVVTLFLRNPRAHGLAHQVLAAAEARRLDEAASLCRAHAGIVPRTLGACLARASQGKAAMEDAVQSQLMQELPRVTRFLRTLAILAAVAPLVGLLGTVTGIIQTFGVIKALGTTDPTLMAGGISVALVTTAAGLSVAIPTMLVQGLLRGRGDRLIADAERYAAALLTLVAHGREAESGADGAA